MEAVSPGLSKPVIRIKISSVLVSIHKMLLFTDCKSTQFNPIKLSFGDSFFSMEWMNLCYITYFFDVIPWSWHKNSLPLPRISKYNGFDYQAKRQCSGEKLLFKGSLG